MDSTHSAPSKAGNARGTRAAFPAKPRVVALAGPSAAGKTSLLEAMLFTAETLPRKGSVGAGTTVGDAGAEARAHRMTVEPNIATYSFLGERWSVVDCPGSVELQHDACAAMSVADIVVVVAEPDPARAMMLMPLLRFLDTRQIPHVIFVNKLDKAAARIRDVLAALQQVSLRPLVLREVPIREGEQVTGYVDLVSERAYRYRPNKPSDLIEMPDSIRPRESEARQAMLETIADFDDTLLEQLLEDRVPAPEAIYAQLARDVQADLIVPVFFGSAEQGNGVLRLLKALRHEAPESSVTATRLGIRANGSFLATVFKTLHQPHTGKLSLVRVWGGSLAENGAIAGKRIGGLYRPMGAELQKAPQAAEGDLVAIAKLDDVQSGERLGSDGRVGAETDWPEAAAPVHALAIAPTDRKDEVKLSAALARLLEEDRGLKLDHAEGGALLLQGQGEMHLKLAVERLQSRYNVALRAAVPPVAYKETIRHGTQQHARFKRQSGGHGQFADIKIEILARPRGAGYAFESRVVGGAIPRNFIPAVDEGAQEALRRGPLGFPVVDVGIALLDGQYHSVDSSDQAFRTCAGIALHEGLPKCGSVLLEPIQAVTFSVPAAFTAKVHAIISGRRGQILGMAARDGWSGWDEISCYIPEAELQDLTTELRSATLGLGSYTARFDHLQELGGKLAERVVEDRKRALAA